MATTVNTDNLKMLSEGVVLNGKYKILKQLSNRALGNIYLANDTKFRENVLIKELFIQNISKRSSDNSTVDVDDTCKDIYNEYIDRFNEEARSLRQLDNEHIAKVTDLFNENNTSYYVMEYIEGELLSKKMMRRNKALTESETISYLTQMLDGLNAMHSHGFWHLDITPSNIIVDDNGHIMFLEFGHCKLVDNESTIVADTNHDPMELQALDENNIGPWTDYYSLGATLYNLLTGKRPPAAAEVNEATTNLYHFPTSVSKKMQRLVLWMMTPNIFRRPQDINEINDFLYGITGSNSNDKTFQKNLSVATPLTPKGNKKSKSHIKGAVNITDTDTDDNDEEDEDGLSNKTLKAMQIFIFLAILSLLGYFAYKALFSIDNSKKHTAKNSMTIKKEESKTVSNVDNRNEVDVLSITNEEEDAKKKEEEKKKLEEKKEEERKLAEAKSLEEEKNKENPNKTDIKSENSNENSSDNKSEVSKNENNNSSSQIPPSETDSPDSKVEKKNENAPQNQDISSQEQPKPSSKNNKTNTNAPTQNESASPKYNVIVGSFSSQENANGRVNELKSQGYNATIRYSESNKMYRVVVAGSDESTKNKLKAKYSDAWVE